ncbi:MAG: hypothetical protein PHT88_03455 [Candidatus Moranbacteria bacterium]|nr:hypothetical protein [Candidatus Moranbacteria bacterium]
MNEEDIPEAKPKNMVKKLVFLLMCAAMFAGVWMVTRMQQPSQGVIRKSPTQVSSVTAPPQEKIRLEGEYLSFAHLSSYTPVAKLEESEAKDGEVSVKKPGAFLQSDFLIAYTAASSKKIAVSVESLPSSNLEDNASFKFRISSPKLYTQSMADIGKEKVILFVRDGDTREQSVFLRHNALVVPVVLSSSNTSLESMREELLAIANSVEW